MFESLVDGSEMAKREGSDFDGTVRARYSRTDYRLKDYRLQEPVQDEAGMLHARRKERATKIVSGHCALGEARA